MCVCDDVTPLCVGSIWSSSPPQRGGQGSEVLDALMCSRQNVDCFSVLLDLWSCEERFMEAKLKVPGGGEGWNGR